MKSALRALPRTGAARPHCITYQWQRRPIYRSLASAAEYQFGQPLHETHPHLLKAGELTPGITALEYAERRAKLAAALPPKSIAILASADVKSRSGSVFYKFHQDPNFLYLTGFNEPDAVAVIAKNGSGASHTFHLYVRPKSQNEEKWEGYRSGIQAAQDVFNADEAGDVSKSLSTIEQLIGSASEVYTDIPSSIRERSSLKKIIFGSIAPRDRSIAEALQKNNARPLKEVMNNLRVIKSDAEVANMRRAGQASGRAFTEAMKHKFDTERDLETFLEYKFKTHGCEESAYVPVVAGGENATQIHYVRNDAAFLPEQLVTVDAGGEYGGYVTDITRSWPVNGKFTPAQKDLYEMVLNVERTCVSLCRQDANMSLDKLHRVAEEHLTDGLKSLGFDMSRHGLDALFPHHLGHYVGLAVHDAPGHSRAEKLIKGHCITIEPGIYVEDDDRWPTHFRGMGIRIEDSVCVQEEHPFVLTTEAVKEVVDIEALRR